MDATAPRSPSPPAARKPSEPYCSACGYSLAGATESARCPECGKPLVEVLARAPAPFRAPPPSKRFRSEATLFGWPIIDIALGPDLEKGEARGIARGVIAIGDVAIGGVALGGMSVGVFAIGGFAVGVSAIGGFAVGGLAALGGGAVGLGLSGGGAAVGSLAFGGAAIGVYAQGGAAIGYYASGGAAFGAHTIQRGQADPAATSGFQRLSWFYGAPSPVPNMLQPMAATGAVALAPGLLVLALAAIGSVRHRARAQQRAAGWGPRA